MVSFQSETFLIPPIGAGKTTTISILVGSIYASGGDAFVNGFSSRYEAEKIRRQLGVCPQHDILWDGWFVNQREPN